MVVVAGLGGGQGSEGLQVTGTPRRLSGCEADSLPTPSRVAILWVNLCCSLSSLSLVLLMQPPQQQQNKNLEFTVY